ncbi:MAG TPA: radical SAM protein [Syntrophorhabdales bacterium]|nr:radical SAM protein [Syntrophorhabdales bacterium]
MEQLHSIESLCPTCLKNVGGSIVSDGRAVYLLKSCSEHGSVKLKIWPDVDHYQWMRSFDFPRVAPRLRKDAAGRCLTSCGLCGRHLRKPTLMEIEVTRRCNLRCPVCFMGAGEAADPGLTELQSLYTSILEEAGPDIAIQLTGGEPTVREDLAEVVRLGHGLGFSAIEINTNGLAIAVQPDLLPRLKESGATGIYLQFDGMSPEVYARIRGADLMAQKLSAVERCREAGTQVVLAMTVIKGINDAEIGKVLEFALRNSDVVAGLALQPAFFSGRFEVEMPDRLSMGDVIFLLAEQSGGLIGPYDLWPLGCSHPLCSAGVYLVEREGKGFLPSTRLFSREEYVREFDPDSPQGSVFADLLAKREAYTGKGLSVVIMNYMDAWSLDFERLQECSMTVKTADLRTVPFCAYHLTNAKG